MACALCGTNGLGCYIYCEGIGGKGCGWRLFVCGGGETGTGGGWRFSNCGGGNGILDGQVCLLGAGVVIGIDLSFEMDWVAYREVSISERALEHAALSAGIGTTSRHVATMSMVGS